MDWGSGIMRLYHLPYRVYMQIVVSGPALMKDEWDLSDCTCRNADECSCAGSRVWYTRRCRAPLRSVCTSTIDQRESDNPCHSRAHTRTPISMAAARAAPRDRIRGAALNGWRHVHGATESERVLLLYAHHCTPLCTQRTALYRIGLHCLTWCQFISFQRAVRALGSMYTAGRTRKNENGGKRCRQMCAKLSEEQIFKIQSTEHYM